MSFYEFLRSAPYVRLLLPFILGIVSGQVIHFPVIVLWISFAVLIAVVILLQIVPVGKNYKFRWLWGVMLTLLIINCGLMAAIPKTMEDNISGKDLVVAGTIIENPKVKESSFKIILKINAVYEGNTWKCRQHKVICTLQKKKIPQPVVLNQRIMLRGSWTEIHNFGNPYEFDYSKFMNRNGFFFQAYIDSAHWKLQGPDLKFSINLWALQLRDKILSYYKQLNLSPSSFAVISALTVGDKSYLDDEIKSAYINSGTMHILAVSGMHVALLFWLLQLITRPLILWKKGKLLRLFVVLLVIWIYALITGLTPSVVRASVMFSFWMLGDAGNKKVNIYNTLSASALFLLLINPDTIFDVGFQLSYLAVLGIVVFYSDIYHWLYLQNKILKYLWGMIAVSLAAQLFTLPISLYNFHQFPNYFILSNIIALPLSTIILYSSIIALVLAPFKFLWLPLGWVLKILLGAMNNALIWVEHLPFSVTTGIGISGIMALCLFIIVVSARFYIYRKKSIYLYLVLICSIVCCYNIYVKRKAVLQTRDIIVYNTPGTVVVQLRDGKRSFIISENSGYDVDRLIKPYNDKLQVEKFHKLFLDSAIAIKNKNLMIYKNFIFFNRKRFFVWDKTPDFRRLPVNIDVLIIAKFKKRDLYLVDKYFKAKEIIVANKVFRGLAQEIGLHYKEQDIPCTILNTDGAWVLSQSKKIDE